VVQSLLALKGNFSLIKHILLNNENNSMYCL
jgi:hypothetical protein